MPEEHIDDRVEFLQADAWELDVRGLFAKSNVHVQSFVLLYSVLFCSALFRLSLQQ